MTLRSRLLWLAVAFGAGCAAPDFDRAEALIDQVTLDLAQDAPAKGLAFVDHARRYGPAFHTARLREAELLLDLDQLRRGALPRLSVMVQGRAQWRESGGFSVRGRNHAFVIEWDFIRAIYVLFRNTPEIFAILVAQESALARQSAEKQLLDQLADTLDTGLALEEAGLTLDAESCRIKDMQGELAHGTLPRTEVAAAQTALQSRKSAHAARRTMYEASRASLAHGTGGAPFRPDLRIAALHPGPSRARTAEQCYAGSALEARNAVLHRIAKDGLDAARIDRWIALSGIVPNQLGPDSPAQLELLLNLMVPLIDQGKGDRQVQRARIAVANALIAARESKAAFMLAHAELTLALAEARVMQAGLTPPARAETGCAADLSARLYDLEERRARLVQEHLEGGLALLCMPAAPQPGGPGGVAANE